MIYGNGDNPNRCKRSFYFPEKMLREIVSEARRLDRSISWVVQRAWKAAQRDIKKRRRYVSHAARATPTIRPGPCCP